MMQEDRIYILMLYSMHGNLHHWQAKEKISGHLARKGSRVIEAP